MGKYKFNGVKSAVWDLKISSKRLAKLSIFNARKLYRTGRKVAKEQFIIFQHSKLYHWLDPRNYQGLERTLHSIGLLIMTGLIFFSVISPIVDIYVTHKYYSLNSQASTLVGSVGDTLAKQISYDSATNAYIFNKDGMKAMTTTVGPDKVPLALLQAKVGGDKTKSKSLYAVSMPTNPKDGITYFDSNTGLSFQMVPNFSEMSAKQIDNHIIYPINSNTQMVYSVKNNGLKEDIILKKFVGDSLSFSYSLNLPQTLEARMLTNGSGELGIYSADPSLFNGSSSLGEDTAKIESAKLKAKKDNLLFAIPAPVIQSTDNGGQTTNNSSFALSKDGETLTISANNLKGLHYPISIDPTVVITSTSDFSTGNNEDNNITYPAGQINRGVLTGGSIGSWAGTTALTNATFQGSSVVYNNFAYELGGTTAGGATSAVYYAAINSNGTIGSWAATTSLPGAMQYGPTVAYSGYIYLIGGYINGTISSTVSYAAINANGTIGTWNSTTALPAPTANSTAVVYNGYVYELGGYNTTLGAVCNVVNYAPINGNGTVGTWTATTVLPSVNDNATSVAYNGYIYEIGGYNGTSYLTTVSYAPINSNGTIGTWIATSSLPVATAYSSSAVYNGYIYEIGGLNPSVSTVVDYAPINANGTLGTWVATSSLGTANAYANSFSNNGYIYQLGGHNGTSQVTTVVYTKIDPAGTTTAYSTTTALPGAISYSTSVAYNGYVYEIGGYLTATVSYAPINANGTIGTWTSTTALPTATYDATSVAYNGYLYLIGGYNSSSATVVVDYAPINANGTIGAWTATTSLPASTTSYNATSVAYNGYVYEIGGNLTAVVSYAPINSNGTLGSWSATTSLPATTTYSTSVVHNGYIYEIGGNTGSAIANVYYALINSNGTIGSWTATTSLPTATQYATSVVYNGYVYAIGGWNGTTYFSTVYYAPLNANGTIGAWATNTSLPAATTYATSVVYNGYIYEMGGGTGSSVATVYYAFINNGGPGTAGAWTATTVLPAAIRDSTAVVYNGYMYEIGGWNGSNLTTVYYAPINANGTIGTWTATTSLPVATANSTSVAYNGYLYEIGGTTTISYDTAVYYAPINANGTIGTWTATTSLPTGTNAATSVAYNGYAYVLGGNTGSPTTTVEYSLINSNGTLGSWTSTTALPTATYGATSVVYNGYVYEIGGFTSAATATVEYALINANGTIGSWVVTTALRLATYYSASIAYNGYLYEIGGTTAGGTITNVDYASFNANGTIGAWTASTSLPVATRAPSVVYNGFVYLIGGFTGGNVTTVDYSPLNVMPRVGHYSKTFNFGTQVAPASITYNGSLSNSYGLSSIQYKTADSTGVFGPSDYSTDLIGSTLDCVVAGTAQYLAVSIVLDDSASASFPDVNAVSSNVTDFTVTMTSYHPSPSVRLRGGKFFSQNTLQALDTCGSYTTVTGGTLTSDATYFYRTFTSSGTFSISGTPLTADVLVIGGGGGGGWQQGGGGGAGGVLVFLAQKFSTNQSVTVGGGGAGSSTSGVQGTTGSDSQFGSLTLVKGGGGGGSGGGTAVNFHGLNGGSGGGASAGGGTGYQGLHTTTQGTDGGYGAFDIGGSGGGANAAGTQRLSGQGAPVGGAGTSTYSSWGAATGTGQNVAGTYYYAGGGGTGGYGYATSGSTPGSAGGAGGGGAGGPDAAVANDPGCNGIAGTANTGGGGGGGAAFSGNGGAGGSGVVIVRYLKTAVKLPVVTGGTLTSDGTYYYRTFLNSGKIKITEAPLTADVMVVGGGGSGGWPYSGGGGAGGFLLNSGISLSASTHTVTIGAGGVGGYNLGNGQKGGNSSLDSYIAYGGGGGVGDSAVSSAQNGGSGGGGADITRNASGNNGGTGMGGQGFAGGVGSPVSSTQASGGGGGGAGAVGANATTTLAGRGGIGIFSAWPSIFTSSLDYLDNGNMENWTAGTTGFPPDSWQDPGSVTMSRDSGTVKSGSYSLKAIWQGAYPQINQYIDITNHPERIGKTYTASAWIYDTAGTGSNTALRVYNGLTNIVIKEHTSASGWELVRASFTLPSGSTSFRVGVGISTGTIYIDDFQVHDYVPGTGEWGYFAGGGGGGTNGAGGNGGVGTSPGGFGGGGKGASNDGYQESSFGLPNTGGGSGGGGAGNAPNSPKSGGSGIVIVRYLMSGVASPASTSERTPTVEYLVVGGGGGSGGGVSGGGGGGGLRTGLGYAVTAGVPITVTVGNGGSGNQPFATNPTPGADSVFGTITAKGGGSGAGGITSLSGQNGGSGSGGAGSTGGAGSGTSGQGNNGGNNGSAYAGGGGGAGTAGVLGGTNSRGGDGGSGMVSSISSTNVTYAGGGGGSAWPGVSATNTGGNGGSGGGGNGGGGINATAGTPNTGGGAGGDNNAGAAGGSGIVIIRYPDAFKDAVSTTGSPSYTNTGGFKIYKFTGSGSITF